MTMPALFIAHGSPMNALANNDFTQFLTKIGREIPRPKAILSISAHWLTAGVWVTSAQKPKMIYDMYGFPQELYQIKYEASGDTQLAQSIASMIGKPKVHLDNGSWGIDHGTWSILVHMYPEANIPVLQLSIDMSEPTKFHYELGQKLKPLRNEDVLIIGSGNIVHNLRMLQWNRPNYGYEWGQDFDLWVQQKIDEKDFESLIHYQSHEHSKLSVPTADHILPLFYVLGAASNTEPVHCIYKQYDMGSISMTSYQVG